MVTKCRRANRRHALQPVGAPFRADVARCVCQVCGSHVQAVVLKQTVSGLCGTCGSCDIAPLNV